MAINDVPLIQPAIVPCTSFDVCQVNDNSSDVYRPAASFNDSEALPNLTYEPSGHEELIECQLCYVSQPESQLVDLITCFHKPCKTCLHKYLQIEIMESRVILACPECFSPLHSNNIYNALKNDKLLTRYEKFMVRRVLVTEPDVRWCPAPDCE